MAATVAFSSPKSTILQNPIFPRDPTCKFFGGSLKGLCLQQSPRSKSRDGIGLVVASANPTVTTSNSNSTSDRFYFNFTGFPFPLGPFLKRRTIRKEVNFFTLVLLPFSLILTCLEVGFFFWWINNFSFGCSQNFLTFCMFVYILICWID